MTVEIMLFGGVLLTTAGVLSIVLVFCDALLTRPHRHVPGSGGGWGR